TRTYSSAANYVYNGTSEQATGSGLPGSVNNLTINNNAGVVVSAGNLAVNGVLAINAGYLDMGTSVLADVIANIGGGTLRTQNTGALPIPPNKTWTVGIFYNSSA